jgi:hypothetical protein
VLPNFTKDGLLPPGDYVLTIDQLRVSALVNGEPSGSNTWDRSWRASLVENLAVMVQQLQQVGISDIFIDGSFVEDKDHPNDIDGYFVCEAVRLASGELTRDLNLLDPDKIWTWDRAARKTLRGDPKPQLPMWHRYRVELFPHVGQLSGIRDQFGHELDFPAAFRQSRRASLPKGIIQIGSST